MALIIETGSGSDPSANSYQTVEQFREYAALRAPELVELDDGAIVILMIKAMDYLESLECRYKGTKANEGQPLAWPRSGAIGVSMTDSLFDSDKIPRKLELAQLSLAVDAHSVDILPNKLPTDKGAIVREKVDVLEVEYADTGKHSQPLYLARSQAHLNDLLERKGLFLVRA